MKNKTELYDLTIELPIIKITANGNMGFEAECLPNHDIQLMASSPYLKNKVVAPQKILQLFASKLKCPIKAKDSAQSKHWISAGHPSLFTPSCEETLSIVRRYAEHLEQQGKGQYIAIKTSRCYLMIDREITELFDDLDYILSMVENWSGEKYISMRHDMLPELSTGFDIDPLANYLQETEYPDDLMLTEAEMECEKLKVAC